MNRLEIAFDALRAGGRKCLVPYITAGYPDAETTIAILSHLSPDRCGAVELGIPFSDPIADGPVIQTSFYRALDAGFRTDDFFAALAAARDRIAVPLIAMVSYSIVYRRGPAEFVADARAAGIDGFIVPDLAFEEAEEFASIVRTHGCSLILIAAPTSDAARRARITALSSPFIYFQAVAGTTGERNALPLDLIENVRQLRGLSEKPVCVGFGISRPEQVVQVCAVADGAIVGSAIVRRMNEAADQGKSGSAIADAVARFVAELGADL